MDIFEISQTPVNDLSIDDIKKDNLVLAVKISWKDSFKKNSKQPSNFPVKVEYHTLENLMRMLHIVQMQKLL